MTIPDPRAPRRDTGHERRALMRYAIPGIIVLFVFLVGYFVLFGPFHEPEPHYRPTGVNPEVEREAAPPKQPTVP